MQIVVIGNGATAVDDAGRCFVNRHTAKFLIDLAGMLMADRLVTVQVFVHCIEQVVVRLDEFLACPGHATVADRDQRGRGLDQSSVKQWDQRQEDAGRVATGIADHLGGADGIAADFAQAIDR